MCTEMELRSGVLHSDIADAVLYAWRCSYSFTYTKPKDVQPYGTDKYWQEEADRMEAAAEEHFAALEEMKKDPWVP